MAETNATLTSKHEAFPGLDVGKFAHWTYAVDRDGEVLLSRRVAAGNLVGMRAGIISGFYGESLRAQAVVEISAAKLKDGRKERNAQKHADKSPKASRTPRMKA